MIRLLIAILLALTVSSPAATYHVSTSGSDTTGDGSQGNPYRTVLGVTNAAPGDIVLVAPGIYTNNVCTPLNGVIYRATGAVSNHFGWNVTKTNVVIDGFIHVSNPSTYPAVQFPISGTLYFEEHARDALVTNCVFYGDGVTMERKTPPLKPCTGVTIIGCTFDTFTNSCFVTLAGQNHRLERSILRNAYSTDGVRWFGSNHVVRACVFTNFVAMTNMSNHPDVNQTWGQDGESLKDAIFERNLVIDCGVQTMQATMDDGSGWGGYSPTNSAEWSVIYRNNLFVRCDGQVSIGIPNVKFWNNTFYRLTSTSAGLQFSFYDITDLTSFRGHAYGGEAKNNVWIECQQRTPTALAELCVGSPTAAEAGGGARTGGGRIWMDSTSYDPDRWMVRGHITNLSGTITGIHLYRYSDWALVFSNYSGGVNYSNAFGRFTNTVTGGSNWIDLQIVQPATTNGFTLNAQAGLFNSGGYGIKICTTTFPDGELAGPLPYFTPSPVPDLQIWANMQTNESVVINTNSLRQFAGSPLIDTGTNLSAVVSNSFDGSARPLGTAFDLGAYEFDPSLLLHWDFDQGFTNGQSYVMDVTGNAHHGIGFNTNNWITPAAGAFGSVGAQFEPNFWSTNGLNYYEGSQYCALTNLTNIEYLTNATISIWASFVSKTGPQKLIYLVDAADRGKTNSWRIGRLRGVDAHRMSMRIYKDGTTDTDGDLVVQWPINAISTTDVTTTNGLEHYAVTLDCTAGTAIAYLNGVPRATNSITFPWISVSPGAPSKWISFGAHKYGDEGTFYWDADGFPNDGYMRGVTDDFRVYNRALSAPEISSLYAGEAGAAFASTTTPDPEPEPEPPPPSSLRIIQGNGTVTVNGTIQ